MHPRSGRADGLDYDEFTAMRTLGSTPAFPAAPACEALGPESARFCPGCSGGCGWCPATPSGGGCWNAAAPNRVTWTTGASLAYNGFRPGRLQEGPGCWAWTPEDAPTGGSVTFGAFPCCGTGGGCSPCSQNDDRRMRRGELKRRNR